MPKDGALSLFFLLLFANLDSTFVKNKTYTKVFVDNNFALSI
jgi:hypothetical protein